MKKTILFFTIPLLLCSCSAASQGEITQDSTGCMTLKNNSTSDKITFVLQYGSTKVKFEEAVGPQQQKFLSCTEDGRSLHIVGAYKNSTY